MPLLRSLEAVVSASGDGPIDWEAVETAATAATPAGTLDVDRAVRAGFAADVVAAHDAIEDVAGLSVAVPGTLDLQSRHHWIAANVTTFRRVLAPLETEPVLLPGLTSRANTATVATLLSVLGRSVLGQYDPGLFGDEEPRLVVVLPNLRRASRTLDVDARRFQRWIVFHEVAHAAEFDAAPWLVGHLEERIRRAVSSLAGGSLDRTAVGEIDAAMTAVEGYAEFVMDRAFDAETADLRAALDARRRAGGPLLFLVRRLAGLEVKRRQYERGRRFFETVAAERGVEGTGAVWRDPDSLPTSAELDRPARWLARVGP